MKGLSKIHVSMVLLVVLSATLMLPSADAFLPGRLFGKKVKVTSSEKSSPSSPFPAATKKQKQIKSETTTKTELTSSNDSDDAPTKNLDESTAESNEESGLGPSLKAGAIQFSKVTDAASGLVQQLRSYNATQVWKNVQEGELGKRGELYFAGQMTLILFVLVGGIPVIGAFLRYLLGPSLIVAGGLTVLAALADLGSDSLSPFPPPPKKGALKTTGIYGQMRHPMYTALLSLTSGLSIATNSADRLLLTVLLWYLLDIKSDKEETFLVDQYGAEYEAYKKQVGEKFLPKFLLDRFPWLR